MDFVLEVSAIKTDQIEVDKETVDMLASLRMADLPSLIQMAPESGPIALVVVLVLLGGIGDGSVSYRMDDSDDTYKRS
ncbi:40S ribosomal protein S17 [Bienertia sinuspersici]